MSRRVTGGQAPISKDHSQTGRANPVYQLILHPRPRSFLVPIQVLFSTDWVLLRLEVKQGWGDCGLASKINSTMLERRQIGDGFCPRDVIEISNRLTHEEGFRAGLKRRAGTEARIGIFKKLFLGRPLLAKGFKHWELAVGWATLTHNLSVVARIAEAEKSAKRHRNQTPVCHKRTPLDQDHPLTPEIWTASRQVRQTHA